MEHFRRHVKIEYKGSADLVTIADRQSEALIIERIRRNFPSHDVMGEEGTRIETGSDDYKWYVDPLDGTTNFAGMVIPSFAFRWQLSSGERASPESSTIRAR